MGIVHPRVAGTGVPEKVIWAAVRLPGDRRGERTVPARRFAAFWRRLQKMAAWLTELGVTGAAVESAGVYWGPAYHALAGEQTEVCARNAAHMRNVPGRKADLRDCRQLAGRHEHGLLRPGFIPAARVAAPRQRTRYRTKLIGQRISAGQRLARVPEDAGIKIDSVASGLPGVPGRAMAAALTGGGRDPARLAELARGVLRRKMEGLQMACDGRFTAAHGQMCRLHPGAYDHLTAKIAGLDVLAAGAAAPFRAVIARLITIPGSGSAPPR